MFYFKAIVFVENDIKYNLIFDTIQQYIKDITTNANGIENVIGRYHQNGIDTLIEIKLKRVNASLTVMEVTQTTFIVIQTFLCQYLKIIQ